MKVQTRYGSYYTAYPTLHPTTTTSYVTTVDGCDQVGAVFSYPPNQANHSIGSTCAEAKQKFTNPLGEKSQTTADRKNLNPASGDNTPSTLAKQQAALDKQKAASPLGGIPTPNLPGSGSISKSGDPGKNPVSGCNNCHDDWWNPAQWFCQAGKVGCEFQAAIGGTGNGIQQFLKDNAIFIGAGLVGIILLFKFIR